MLSVLVSSREPHRDHSETKTGTLVMFFTAVPAIVEITRTAVMFSSGLTIQLQLKVNHVSVL